MFGIEDENRRRLEELAGRIPKGVPQGWQEFSFAVGGLLYIGFSETYTEKLICISSQRQSLIDCETGAKVYCDENYDEHNLIACAQELGDEIVPIAGIGGGGLRLCSEAGDFLERIAPYWPQEQVIFMPKYASWYSKPEQCSVIFEDYEIRACGFSRCGRYMAACSASDLKIFRKLALPSE